MFQTHDHTDTCTTALARAIFDHLLANDCLGLLLSTKHFATFVRRCDLNTTAYENPEHLHLLLVHIASDPSMVSSLHQLILKKFDGFFIHECRLDEAQLQKVLDHKINALFPDSQPERLSHPPSCAHTEQIELAWRYRRACAGMTSFY